MDGSVDRQLSANLYIRAYFSIMKKLLTSCLAILAGLNFNAQDHSPKVCATGMDGNIKYMGRDLWTAPTQRSAEDCFVIPVVIHVYDSVQGGFPVNEEIINGAMEELNKDFLGLNWDFDLVHQDYLALRGTMPDVQFVLAQLDPDGNPTNGIVFHPEAAGYANWDGYDAEVAADAWDNYMYMNVFVMNDLFDDGVTYNSGYGYYPDTWMSDNNLARIVYNGRYLGVNCDWEPEFAGTFTHEFGHWLDLRHTFESGCTYPNDFVDDTPPCDYFLDGYICPASDTSTVALNCEGDLINTENYMDYAGSAGCYRMFTEGQVERMYDVLYHPSRVTLWQDENLMATGLEEYCSPSVSVAEEAQVKLKIFPNPFVDVLTLEVTAFNGFVRIFDTQGRMVEAKRIKHAGGDLTLDLASLESGMFSIVVEHESGDSRWHSERIIKQ